ncbi:hypothetical protein BDW22DRAFT_1327332, partial [Trametopsis cervina]
MIRRSGIQGIHVPGAPEKIVASLFADDTTTFLNHLDSYDDLVAVLDNWCAASGAQFNKSKTVLIPVGSPAYRAQVIATRKLNNEARALPPDVVVLPDGSSTRILGAWIGNGVDQEASWAPTLRKIDLALARWQRCNPTMRGKRLVTQMIVAGMTQYLTKVQGMPTPIEQRLTKTIQRFVWNGAAVSPINVATLQKPAAEGGIKLLDLPARNDAIELTWLSSYLLLSTDRPQWAYLADALIAHNVVVADRATLPPSRRNTFAQSWRASTHSTSRLPACLKRMLRLADKYHVTLSAVRLPESAQCQLPIWHH